ncbi:MAG: hypothetical protein KC646_04190 [Candidatus Cloacimonetes bacterium]|nr:hypothetical protein [Candidatus Cloacimonadota bacterium]
MEVKQSTIREILESFLDSDIHLYSIKISAKTQTIDIFLDKEGGLNLDEFTIIHKEFMSHVADTDFDNYIISFSTPGLSRKCCYPQDFLFYKDKAFEVLLKNGKCHVGLVQVHAENNTLSILNEDKEVRVSWEEVKKASFKLEF